MPGWLCRAYGSGKEDSPMCDVPGFENCRMKLLRHVSFVDCPVMSQCNNADNCLSFFVVVFLALRVLQGSFMCYC